MTDETPDLMGALRDKIEQVRNAKPVDPQDIVAAGGWCSPGGALAYGEIVVAPNPYPEVQVSRGGIAFKAFNPPTPLTPEERAEQRAREEQARAERKAAGGEWRYAIRITDEDGDVEILDGSRVWEAPSWYYSAEEALSENRWEYDNAYEAEVLRRWIADPPEWEVVTIEVEQ